MLYDDFTIREIITGALYGLAIGLGSTLCVYLISWLVLVIHEGGHFLAARHVDAKIDEVVLGNGPLLSKFKFRDVDWMIHLWPSDGHVAIQEGIFALSVREHVKVVLGGPVASLLLAATMTAVFYPVIWKKSPPLTREAESEERAVRLRLSATEELIQVVALKLVPRTLLWTSWATLVFCLIPFRGRIEGEKVASDGLPSDGLQLYWLLFPEWKRAARDSKASVTSRPENQSLLVRLNSLKKKAPK